MPLYIHDYVRPEQIVFPETASRDETLDALVDVAAAAKLVEDVDAFRKAIHEREKLVSTGIGLGVAVPHAKMPSIDDFFVVVGILRKEVDWDAIDRKPVRLVFLIGGPTDDQQTYLQILSKIVLLTKSPRLRSALLSADSADSIATTISGL